MREFENIITVVNEGVSYSDEGGGYIALFAVIAEGLKIETNLNPMNGVWARRLEVEDGTLVYHLAFTKDWKMNFGCGYVDSDVFMTYHGTCRMIWNNYDNDKITVGYEYSVKETDRSEMTGEVINGLSKTA